MTCYCYFGLAVALLLAGCGDSGNGQSSSSGGTAGAPSTGGSVAQGGAISSGGSKALGGTTSGGNSVQGGSTVTAGTPCTSNCPTGNVIKCFTTGCPLGACDNAGFYSSTLCSTTYSKAVDANTIFCAAGQSSSYCLATLSSTLDYYAVTCDNGIPTVVHCPNAGCGVSGAGASC